MSKGRHFMRLEAREQVTLLLGHGGSGTQVWFLYRIDPEGEK
jgi:hypothetical protein